MTRSSNKRLFVTPMVERITRIIFSPYNCGYKRKETDDHERAVGRRKPPRSGPFLTENTSWNIPGTGQRTTHRRSLRHSHTEASKPKTYDKHRISGHDSSHT